MASKNIPKARENDLVVQELKDEVLIYDLKINKAYCLNETSAAIWNLCDGHNSVSDISRKLSNRLKQLVTDDLVYLALDQLKTDELLSKSDELEIKFNGLSRREAIRKVGLASMVALPIIASLVAPTAAMAQSPGSNLCEEIECPFAQTQCKLDGVCDPATGNCLEPNRPDGTPCDDGDANTSGDVCINRVCVGKGASTRDERKI